MSSKRLALVMGVIVVGVTSAVAATVPLIAQHGLGVLFNVGGIGAGVLAVVGAIVGIDVTGGDQ